MDALIANEKAKAAGPVGVILEMTGFISTLLYGIKIARDATKKRDAGDEYWKKDAQFAAFLFFTCFLFILIMILSLLQMVS